MLAEAFPEDDEDEPPADTGDGVRRLMKAVMWVLVGLSIGAAVLNSSL